MNDNNNDIDDKQFPLFFRPVRKFPDHWDLNKTRLNRITG